MPTDLVGDDKFDFINLFDPLPFLGVNA